MRSQSPRRGGFVLLVALALIVALATWPGAVAAEGPPRPEQAPPRASGWIVGLAAGWGRQALQASGDAQVKPLDVGQTEALRLSFTGQTTAADAVARLLQNPAVAYVEPDTLLQWYWTPNDPYYPEQGWAQVDHLPDAWAVATGQASTIIAVIDTGVRPDHPDLKGKLVPGYDFFDGNDNPLDDVGHGTGVAGIAAARGNDGVGIAGAAMNVQIMPLRVGNGDGAPISDVAQAIHFAVDHGAAVINLSLGEVQQSPTLLDAIQYAYDRNVVIVAAAGNDPNQASFPASYPQVISVGATTADGKAVASFTSQISRVDIGAPGMGVLTDWWDAASQQNGWAWVEGTSFATPMVSGTVALLKSINPKLTVEQVRAILTGTAHPLSKNQGVGAGLLDAGEAVRHALLPDYVSVWQPADRPVAAGAATRTWEWGPNSWQVGTEPYTDSQQGQRLVAYFDKARMEINNPYGDPNSPWFVTTGLLVTEMISGQMQVGNDSFQPRGPAQIPVAGDPDDTSGPTYASFTALTQAQPLTEGSTVLETINRSGQVGSDQRLAGYGVVATDYVPDTNHRVASVFRDYLNSSGVLYQQGQFLSGQLFSPAFYATGFPITEPYWVRVKVGGTIEDVLVQCFQRRCLTYTPSNPAGWQVEMGNVGRHYYTWRYGTQPPASSPDDPTALAR